MIFTSGIFWLADDELPDCNVSAELQADSIAMAVDRSKIEKERTEILLMFGFLRK
jgi:hypothetical protein